MHIQDFRAFINKKLDEAEAKHGNIPVVAWHPAGKLCEYQATQLSVSHDFYRAQSDRTFKSSDGVVLILADTSGDEI